MTKKLKKNLGLYDVFAIGTGAMFSSGFFLLPGLATAEAGPSTFLSYFLAGVMVLPTLFSKAELCTAMPKAGGSYYFMDRSLGPLMGTIGGLGTWLALVFKSAFALIGMGAYLVIFIDLPMKPVAIGLTVAFTLLNIFGVKETTFVQRVLVTALIAILSGFIIAGLIQIGELGWSETRQNQLEPFFPFGIGNTIYTAGLVFVSYAGLTKVASVAEEVRDPEKNIPNGMLLSLGAATLLYVLGVYILVALLPASELREDLTPIATAASEVLGWIPGEIGLIIVVVAAIAAFTSTANAGILSSSRYPLAMARDQLLTPHFKKVGKKGTPRFAIVVTGTLMVMVILSFSELGMAKLASAFQLLIFAILNLAVIIMRESKIPSYLPGYKSPLYPWMQIVGIAFSIFLITNMGLISILFSTGIILVSIVWFYTYARKHVVREGAIYHIFERLGRDRHKGLEEEMKVILKEKGPIDPVSYEDMIARAQVFTNEKVKNLKEAVEKTVGKLKNVQPLDRDSIMEHVIGEKRLETTPIFKHIAVSHFSDPEIEQPEIVIMRFEEGITFHKPGNGHKEIELRGLILLSGNESAKGMHLRFLSQLANHIDTDEFQEKWRSADTESKLKECLLDEENYMVRKLEKKNPASDWIGKKTESVQLEEKNRVLYIYRDGQTIIPEEDTEFKEQDHVVIAGPAKAIKREKGD